MFTYFLNILVSINEYFSQPMTKILCKFFTVCVVFVDELVLR